MILVLTVTLLFSSNSYAGGCYTSYVREVIKEIPVPVAAFYALPVYPAYAVGYQPPLIAPLVVSPVVAPPMPVVSDCKAATQRLEQELAQLRQQIAALTGQQPTPTPAPNPGPNPPFPFKASSTAEAVEENVRGLNVMQAKCIQCHERTVAGAKSKGLVLFEGKNPTVWDAALQKKIITNIHLGRMPPPKADAKGPVLTDEEVGIVIQWMDQLPVK